jgi:hypothetical protein
MTKQTHGGARPKVRENDNRGGKRPGAGRPRSVAKLKKGDYLVMERETIGGEAIGDEIQQPQMWQVLSIGGDDGSVIEFQCGNDIIVLRPPAV